MADSNPLFNQADALWKILDDLAETNPEGYTKFMEKFLREHEDWVKPPEPVFCFRTLKLPEASNHHIFINICKWEKVPAPTEENDKISVVASDLRELPDCNARHSAIDLCFHKDIINETANVAQCRKIIASMAIEFVEKQSGFQLSKAYKILAIKYKGEEKDLRKFLFRRKLKPKQEVEKSPESKKQSVLQGLSKIVQQGKENNPSGLSGEFEGLPGDIGVGKKSSLTTTKKPLIEEVSTPTLTKTKPVPKHGVEVVEAISGRPRCIVVTVDLPAIESGAECELDVSKEDLLLSSPHYSKLQVQLPEKGNEDETTSTFNKKTHQLTVTIPAAMN